MKHLKRKVFSFLFFWENPTQLLEYFKRFFLKKPTQLLKFFKSFFLKIYRNSSKIPKAFSWKKANYFSFISSLSWNKTFKKKIFFFPFFSRKPYATAWIFQKKFFWKNLRNCSNISKVFFLKKPMQLLEFFKSFFWKKPTQLLKNSKISWKKAPHW